MVCAGHASTRLFHCHPLGQPALLCHRLRHGFASHQLQPSGGGPCAGSCGHGGVLGVLPSRAPHDAPAQNPRAHHHLNQEDEPLGPGEACLLGTVMVPCCVLLLLSPSLQMLLCLLLLLLHFG